jgi:hypothetical protein
MPVFFLREPSPEVVFFRAGCRAAQPFLNNYSSSFFCLFAVQNGIDPHFWIWAIYFANCSDLSVAALVSLQGK